jgi:hypothetical protein
VILNLIFIIIFIVFDFLYLTDERILKKLFTSMFKIFAMSIACLEKESSRQQEQKIWASGRLFRLSATT